MRLDLSGLDFLPLSRALVFVNKIPEYNALGFLANH